MADHATEHDICPECWLTRHPGSQFSGPGAGPVPDAVRCCWCGSYTRVGLTDEAPADEVPRHQRDPRWLAGAGFRPEELVSEPDPREVHDQ